VGSCRRWRRAVIDGGWGFEMRASPHVATLTRGRLVTDMAACSANMCAYE
jgi:hypothetical protein